MNAVKRSITTLFVCGVTLSLGAAGCTESADDNNVSNNTTPQTNNTTTPANNSTSNNSTSNNTSNNSTTNNSTSNNSTANNSTSNNSTSNNSTANNSTSNNSTPKTCPGITPYDGQRVMMCDEIGATACFENSECAGTERCEDVGDGIEVACCVTAPRGCKAIGETCEGGEIECESGVCIGRNDGAELCTKGCESDADCPASQPECASIPFAGQYCVEADS